jgi:energy-coupling factor transport system substrate-specific component
VYKRQGLACEAIFFLWGRWENYRLSALMGAGVAAALISFVHDYPLYGFAQLAPGMQITLLIVRLISGAVLGGWLAKSLGDALAKTGVLDNYPIGNENHR